MENIDRELENSNLLLQGLVVIRLKRNSKAICVEQTENKRIFAIDQCHFQKKRQKQALDLLL
ncbi:MAG: hypothetical protein ACLU9V_00235 [Roseburia sp.]